MGLGLRRLARLALALALLGALLGALPAPAVSAATTYTVNALTDTGAGSGTTGDLRYAITQVNAGGGTGDTINITATGTILLGSTLPTLSQSVTISGPGAVLLTIDGGCTTCDPGGAHTDGVPVFNIGAVAATIGGVTIRHGNAGGEATGGDQQPVGRDADGAGRHHRPQLCEPRRRHLQQRFLDADRGPDDLRGEHAPRRRRHQQQRQRHPDGDEQHLRQQPGAGSAGRSSTTNSTRRASPPRRSAATVRPPAGASSTSVR